MNSQLPGIVFVTALCATLGYLLVTHESRAGASAAAPSTQPAGVAVVELFTSEGCSSCPPAEDVLARIEADTRSLGQPVYPLAFHVDYWNHLGWSDRFSDSAFSGRQRDYAQSLSLKQIYTPQMIVNGSSEFVGSYGAMAKDRIATALATRAKARVEMRITGSLTDGFKLSSTVTGGDKDSLVNFAVVERDLSTEVRSGENGGRKLTEPSVVRWFKSLPLSDSKEISIPPLPAVLKNHASVVAYVQQPGPGAIIGASSLELP